MIEISGVFHRHLKAKGGAMGPLGAGPPGGFILKFPILGILFLLIFQTCPPGKNGRHAGTGSYT